MDCPKCRTTLRRLTNLSRSSSLHQEQAIGFVEGLTCWNCGYYLDDPQVTMPMPPIRVHRGCQHNGSTHVIASEIAKFVASHLDEIKKMRLKKMSWLQIKAELGMKCTEKTIRSHYLKQTRSWM